LTNTSVKDVNNSKLAKISGLTEYDWERILEAIKAHKDIEKAVLFGSRAMGNYKRGSDVDIALSGTHLTSAIVDKVSIQLNQHTTMPYHFDILNGNTIENKNLQKHIDENGVVIL